MTTKEITVGEGKEARVVNVKYTEWTEGVCRCCPIIEELAREVKGEGRIEAYLKCERSRGNYLAVVRLEVNKKNVGFKNGARCLSAG